MMAAGVSFGPQVATGAKLMLITSVSFYLIQIPVLVVKLALPTHNELVTRAALVGTICCVICIVYYLRACMLDGNDQPIINAWVNALNKKKGGASIYMALQEKVNAEPSEEEKDMVMDIIRPFFSYQDRSKDDQLQKGEMVALMHQLGAGDPAGEATKCFSKLKKEEGEGVNLEELRDFVIGTLGTDTVRALGQEAEGEGEEEVEGVDDLKDLYGK